MGATKSAGTKMLRTWLLEKVLAQKQSKNAQNMVEHQKCLEQKVLGLANLADFFASVQVRWR